MRLLAAALWWCGAAWAQGINPPPAARQEKPATPAAAHRPAGPPSVRDLKYPALRPIALPKIEPVTLANGMKVYLLEDHDLPLIHGIAMVRTGSVLDPKDKIGLAALAGIVMRTGGAKGHSGDEVDRMLENAGGSVDAEIGQTSATVSFSALKESADNVFTVLHDVMTAPEFRQDKIEAAKTQLHTAIATRNDDPARVAEREFRAVLYGKDSPYGSRQEYATVERITRGDLLTFHQRYFFPANVMLGVWGDFDAAAMKARLEKLFGDWTTQGQPVTEFPAAEAKLSPGTFVAGKRDQTQAFFVMGVPSGKSTDPDQAALEVLANILGAGYESRLMIRARITLADASNLRASWSEGLERPGVFEVTGSTKAFTALDTLKAVQEETERLRTAEVTELELQTARDTALRGLVFAFDTRAKVMRRVLTQGYYGYPKDFLQQHQKSLEAVTRADVLRVAKQRLDPKSYTIVAVANPQEFGPRGLEGLGNPVTAVDLTIPALKLEAARSDAASLDRGRQILARAQVAAGGAEKLAAVKDYSQTADFRLASGLQVRELDRWISPGYFRQETDVPTGKIRVYYDGRNGWISTAQGSGPLTGAQLKQVQGDLFRVIFRLLLSDRIAERVVNALDENSLEVSDPAGQITRVTFDPRTGLISSVRYQNVTVAGPPSAVEETWADFREVAGIKVPYKITITQNGAPFADMTVTDYQLNSGLKLQDLEKRQ